MLYTMQVDNGGSTYADRVRWPKYSGTQNVYTLGYSDAGKLLKYRVPGWSKDDHFREAKDLIALRKNLQGKYDRLVDRSLHALGGDPGPLISGIVSDKFSAHTKRQLRSMATHIGQLGGAAAAHFAAAGKRLDTFRAKIRG